MIVKITRTALEAAIAAAMDAVSAGDGARSRYEVAVSAGLAAIGITVEDVSDECLCSRDVREYCHSSKCHGGANFRIDHVWIERMWRDVREGDVIRPPGQTGHEAEAVTIGAMQHWHAAPDANEYRPNESPMEWASIPVTLRKLDTGEGYAPPNGMNPDAAVEIRVTRGELAAIEACGGWGQRVGVIDDGVSRG